MLQPQHYTFEARNGSQGRHKYLQTCGLARDPLLKPHRSGSDTFTLL